MFQSISRACLVSLIVAGTLALTTNAHAVDKVKLTIPVFIPAYAYYFVALDKGYFKDEGIDVEVVKAGGGTATPALLSGDVQFSGSPGAALSAILRGGALKLILVSSDRTTYQLWASDPNLKTLSDLKGKVVGVISRGDTHELAIRLALTAKGIDPDAVSYTALGFGRGRIAGLMSGSLPAASLTNTEYNELKNVPGVHLLADHGKTVKMLVGGAVTSDSLIKSNPGLVKRFLKASIKGRRYMRAFKQETLDAVKKRNPKAPRKALEASYDESITTMTEIGTTSTAVQQQEIDIRSKLLDIPASKKRKIDDVFAFSFVRDVNRELDAAGWKPKK